MALGRMKGVVGSLILAVILVVVAIGGPCDGQSLRHQPCSDFDGVLFGDGMRLTLNGTRMTVHGYDGVNEAFDTKAALIFQFVQMGEYRLRNAQRLNRGCLANADTVISTLALHTCSCSVSPFVHETLDYKEVGYRYIIDGCPAPQQNFSINAYVSTSNTSITQVFNNTMEHSIAPSFTYEHPAGGAKFGMNMTGWNWDKAPQSLLINYLSASFDIGLYSEYPLESYQIYNPEAYIQNTTMGPFQFIFKVDLGVLLDGIPAISSGADNTIPIKSPAGTFGEIVVVPQNAPYCQPLPPNTSTAEVNFTKWNEYYYDPSMLVLFNAPPEDSQPPVNGPTPVKLSDKGKVIAIAVSVSIVGALVVAAILAVVFIPSVRETIRPFSKAKKAP